MTVSIGASRPEVPAWEKRSVALRSVLAAALLTLLKAVVGLSTGSLGILSEAAHSGLDLIAALVTYISVRLSARPADSSHPFGHGKFEHLSAFIQTGLLLITCVWIVVEAVERLFFSRVRVDASLAAFAVMIVSIGVDVLRSRSLGRAAGKYRSQALEADALHFSTDIYGSIAVIAGLVLVSIAERWGVHALRVGDPFAALVVAGITVYISVQLGKRTVAALTDAAPSGTAARIARAIAAVPGVLRHDRIRVRQSGDQLFVDLLLTLHGNIPLEHAQAVEDQVESKVHEAFPEADVVIHSTPQQPPPGDLVEKIRAVANRGNFQVHDVMPFRVRGRVNLSLDLELDPSLTLAAAHRRATELEDDIKRELAEVKEVNVHIEPMPRQVPPAREAKWLRADMEKDLLAIARSTPGLLDCHSLQVHQAGENLLVNLHCTLEPQLPLARVHDITEDLEFRFRRRFPHIAKVSVHAEPRGES